MDSWSIAWQIASAVLAVLLAAWGVLGRTPAGWWCFTLATVPIAIVAFSAALRVEVMLTRMALGGLAGAVTGACFFIGAIELLHVPAAAQAATGTSGDQKTVPNNNPPSGPPATGSITTTNQSGGINNTGNMTINQEDKSVKRRMRDLFNMVDPRILYAVTQGQTRLTVRMQPFEINKLQALITESGSESVVNITGYGRNFVDSVMNNGSLGTSQAVHEQREVLLTISPSIQ